MEDAILYSMSAHLCDAAAVEAIFDVGLFILLVGLSSRDSSSKTTLGRFRTSYRQFQTTSKRSYLLQTHPRYRW